MDIQRKSAQEVEIDHLLAEEFSCDPGFADRFLKACGFQFAGFAVTKCVPEPSLSGLGFGDLLVQGTVGNRTLVILIEDKISAGPGFRQAERYHQFAEELRQKNSQIDVVTVLVAPYFYHGQSDVFDAKLSLEALIPLIESNDARRRDYRRAILTRAITKNAATGVKIADTRLHQLRVEYLAFAEDWCKQTGQELRFPPLMPEYHAEDSWIDKIRHPAFPDNVWLRHRLWTSVKTNEGRVDLVIAPPTDLQLAQIAQNQRPDMIVETYGKSKGTQVSIFLPELRQDTGFDSAKATIALDKMREFIAWYQDNFVDAGGA